MCTVKASLWKSTLVLAGTVPAIHSIIAICLACEECETNVESGAALEKKRIHRVYCVKHRPRTKRVHLVRFLSLALSILGFTQLYYWRMKFDEFTHALLEFYWISLSQFFCCVPFSFYIFGECHKQPTFSHKTTKATSPNVRVIVHRDILQGKCNEISKWSFLIRWQPLFRKSQSFLFQNNNHLDFDCKGRSLNSSFTIQSETIWLYCSIKTYHSGNGK